MSVAIVASHAAAGLLVVSGVTKVLRPSTVLPALAALRLPAMAALAIAIGGAEIAVGGLVIAVGGPWSAGLQALTYAGFAVVVLAVRTRDETAPCGCFGTATPPGVLHLAVDVVLCGAAVAAAGDLQSVPGTISGAPVLEATYIGLLATATYTLHAALGAAGGVGRDPPRRPWPRDRIPDAVNFVVALLGLVVALLTLLVVGLLRSHAEILRALHALGVHLDGREPEAVPAGAAPQPADAASLDRGAADVTGVTAGGEQVAVGVRDTGHMTLLAFLSTGCLTCAGLWRELASASARAEIRAAPDS